MLLLPTVAYGISAQWDLDPISGDWNTAANWTPMGVPNGPADVATFGLSHTTDVSISANTEVNSIIFTPAATNPYTISVGNSPYSPASSRSAVQASQIIRATMQNFATVGGARLCAIIFTNGATA